MFVLVFGYVFGSGMAVPGDGNYREYLLPGVFVMTMLYGIGATATGMATDLNRGVVDRFRSMPVARSALVAGRSAADLRPRTARDDHAGGLRAAGRLGMARGLADALAAPSR